MVDLFSTMCYYGAMLQDQVICKTDPDLWFSDSPSERRRASDLCDSCFFKEDCKILGTKEVFGVWGGEDRTGATVEKIVTCRSGKHVNPKKDARGCLECRKESQATYYQKNKKIINQKKPPRIKPRKHVEGGYCVNGHKLEGTNITVRSSDKALLCRKCITGRTYGKYRKNSSSRS